nr:hypothetical protein [Tanacetum cinerariifolium]
MLAVVDNVHGICHVLNVDNIDYLRIHAMSYVCLLTLWKVEGQDRARIGRLNKLYSWIVVAAMPYVCLLTLWKVEGQQRARIGRSATSTGYNAGCKWLFLQGHEAYVEHIRLSQCPKKFNKPPQLRAKRRDKDVFPVPE